MPATIARRIDHPSPFAPFCLEHVRWARPGLGALGLAAAAANPRGHSFLPPHSLEHDLSIVADPATLALQAPATVRPSTAASNREQDVGLRGLRGASAPGKPHVSAPLFSSGLLSPAVIIFPHVL